MELEEGSEWAGLIHLQLGLIGVFPYSAIDMGTYETLRRAYVKSTGCDEPGVMATLSFGALSGSIGAASVYREYSDPFSSLPPSTHPSSFDSSSPLYRPSGLAILTAFFDLRFSADCPT